ncbi:glycosyltransferase family 9 protein [Phenylobacterium soli]|uniref:Glycosyltransferase n=1 Tax=Phenylobacterium soli TaxID=2170551 RepID=A0A328AKS1_9CAUL|nr:glycosyltransferase family 9 protein [Phenylobacterium soli]RAK54985.1 hypothetical protein DJ017_10825 [Phenylobacterium soli]
MESVDPAADLRAEGERLLYAGRFAEAETLMRALLERAPDDVYAEQYLSQALLGQGRYAEAWPLQARRLEAVALGSPRPPLEEPEWQGGPVAGKRLLVIGEQGLGDQIMYARFVPVLRELGADVTLLCRASLTRLFEASLDVQVFGMAGRVDVPDPDCWVLTASLPAKLGVTLETLPTAPYLRAGPRRTPGARIGVASRGNPQHRFDGFRSLPAEEAERLLALPGAIDLSPEATGASDMAETAEIVAGLDLVIAVDTSAAHLAGALGKPVFVLLPAMGLDWRWMAGRSDSPWYPSARLFRQARPGDWHAVVDVVMEAARAVIEG